MAPQGKLMTLIEQAVFTSSRTDRMDGYQLVAASAGVTAEQAEEITAWGPAHDSLLSPESRIGSVNFHRLDSGPFCISKTVPSGAEYSGRSGPRIYTTCLLASAATLERFSNQPFRILDAAVAAGYLRVVRRVSDTLPPVKLRGRASPALPMLLEPLDDADQRSRVTALAAAVCHGKVLVQFDGNLRPIVDRLFNILPIECRSEISFTTGLKYSPRRPFDLSPAPADAMDGAHVARQSGAELLDLNSPPSDPLDGWPAIVDELLDHGKLCDLVALLAQPRPEATLSALATWTEAVTV